MRVSPWRHIGSRYAYRGLFLKENIMAENEIPEPPDWSDARTFFLEPDLWHEPYELDAS